MNSTELLLPNSLARKLLTVTPVAAMALMLTGCPSSSTPTTPSQPSSSSSVPAPSSPSSSSSSMPSPSSQPSGAEQMPQVPSSSSGSPSTGNSGGDSGSTPSPSGGNPTAMPSPAGGSPGDMADAGDTGDSGGDSMETGGGSPAEVVFEDGPPMPSSPSDVMPDLSDEEVDPSAGGASASADEAGGQTADASDVGGASGGGASGGEPILTTAEQVAVLDGELARGTGDFDEMILREREYVRRTATNGTEAEKDEQAGSNASYPGDIYGVPGGGTPSNDSGTGGVPAGGRQGDYAANAATYPPPADIPEGNDDDVVARQLREAAMREPDPELREKLWDEYRKYKGIKP